MRVALLGPLPREAGRPAGGVEATVELLAGSLVALGAEVVVIDPFTGYPATSTPAWTEVRLGALSPWRMGSSRAPAPLRRAVAAAEADVLHVHLGMQYCRLHAASVATVHGFPHLESRLRNPGLRGRLAAPILRRPVVKGLASAKRVISISEEVTRAAARVGVPSQRIATPVARQFFEVQRVEGSDFVAIGDVMRRKNQHLLIEGFTGFVRGGGQGDLLILGAVGDEAYLRQCRAAADAARGRVHFVGPKSRGEVVSYVGRAKACVSASLRETSSIAIVEALAANCPVVSLDVGTAREHLGADGAAGVVLPLDSTAGDLTEALFAVASRPPEPGALRSRVIVHHPDTVARETFGGYARLAG